MRKYIFITNSICNIGGAEQYLNNKVQRLRKAGFEPFIFSYRHGDVLLNNLKIYYEFIQPLLRFSPTIYHHSDVEKVLSQIVNVLGNIDEDVYIESTDVIQAEWGEMLAKRLGAKHICINLQESHNYEKAIVDFLYFKYTRRELYGISKDSINQIFHGIYKVDDETSYIKAECINVVQDIITSLVDDIPTADYTIGSIGRLDKPFLKGALKEVLDFSKTHSDKKINLILIGGGTELINDEIKETIGQAGNICLMITGYLYPIPLSLILSIDCFFSSAGSAFVSMRCNRPTISMAADNGEPLGILNYTTRQALYADMKEISPSISLSKYIEMVLCEECCKSLKPLGMEIEHDDFDEEFIRQLSFFNNELISQDYFDVTQIKPITRKSKVYRLIAHIIGGRFFEKIQYGLHSIKRKQS